MDWKRSKFLPLLGNIKKSTMGTHMIWFLSMLWCLFVASKVASSSIAKDSSCPDRCGNVSVPYPFGVGVDCAYNRFFNLTCNSTTNPPTLILGRLPVRNISVEEGTIILGLSIAYMCYNGSGPLKRTGKG